MVKKMSFICRYRYFAISNKDIYLFLGVDFCCMAFSNVYKGFAHNFYRAADFEDALK